MSTNQKRYTSDLATTSIWSLVIFSMLATGASSAFAQDCVRDPAWPCDGDVDGNGSVNPADSGIVQAHFGSTDEADLCQYDIDCDGQINPVDSGIVQSLFGTCNAPRAACP